MRCLPRIKATPQRVGVALAQLLQVLCRCTAPASCGQAQMVTMGPVHTRQRLGQRAVFGEVGASMKPASSARLWLRRSMMWGGRGLTSAWVNAFMSMCRMAASRSNRSFCQYFQQPIIAAMSVVPISARWRYRHPPARYLSPPETHTPPARPCPPTSPRLGQMP